MEQATDDASDLPAPTVLRSVSLTPDDLLLLEQAAAEGHGREPELTPRTAAQRTNLITRKVAALPDPDQLGLIAGAVVMDLAMKVLEGKVKPTPQNIASLAKTFHDIARLEQGKATGITANLNREEALALVRELQDRAKGRASKARPA